MIHHLNNMLSSETNAPSAGQNRSVPLSQSRLENFHGALSDAVSSTLEKFGIHPNQVQISITRAHAIANKTASTATNTVVRTAPPPPKTGSSSPNTNSTGSTGSAPNGGYDPFLQAATNNPYKSTAATSGTATSNSTAAVSNTSTAAPNAAQAAANSEIAFDNAYWAAQPSAVQELRNIQNPAERTSLATQLAGEGYSIDVPIMVWGWDPSITTSMREADGYTWVPSANQNPVEMAPGIPSTGGVAAYDPANPPAGSIAV